eukprot:5094079-Prymnesium_polylepis.1
MECGAWQPFLCNPPSLTHPAATHPPSLCRDPPSRSTSTHHPSPSWLVGAARAQRASRHTACGDAMMFVRKSGTAQGEAGERIGKTNW